MQLTNKVIVLTGANGLLGKTFIQSLLAEGASLALIDLSFDEEIMKKFSGDNRVQIFNIDITNEYELEKCFQVIFEHFSRIDGLVNNAAINPKVEDTLSNMTGLDSLNYSNWKKELDVGLYGAVLCSKFAFKYIAQNSDGGSIVNIGSDYGHLAPKQSLYKENSKKPITYSVVKFGLIGATKYLATYFAYKKVRVNALSPGGIFNGQDIDFVEKISREIPLSRMAQSDEICGALVFLLSDKSTYVTGLDLIIDGGRSAW